MALGAIAVGATGAGSPDRQYAELRQHCALYTDTARADFSAQICREVKGAIRAEKRRACWRRQLGSHQATGEAR